MTRFLLLALSALVVCLLGGGCVAAAEVAEAVMRSGIVESVVAGTAESVIAANTDLSGGETAALAGVVATGVRSLVAKPLEAWISRNWGTGAGA